MRAQEYKQTPTDQILRGERIQKVSSISSPVEAIVIDTWPTGGLQDGSVYLRSGNSAASDIPDESVDLIVTDPPYMDNVHYSELADFFHGWLRELAPFPSYPAQAATTRNGGEVQSPSPGEFETAISQVWQECARVLRSGGILAFTFHQARISGWVALMRALANSGFTVTAVQPVQGEMITSVTKGGTEPSNLDAIVICRKMQEPRTPRTDPEEAAEAAVRRLLTLLDAGITVGAGDIRSVVRGQVLAIYTEAPSEYDLAQLADHADELASERVTRLSARQKYLAEMT